MEPARGGISLHYQRFSDPWTCSELGLEAAELFGSNQAAHLAPYCLFGICKFIPILKLNPAHAPKY